jgi:hypothetical protein
MKRSAAAIFVPLCRRRTPLRRPWFALEKNVENSPLQSRTAELWFVKLRRSLASA